MAAKGLEGEIRCPPCILQLKSRLKPTVVIHSVSFHFWTPLGLVWPCQGKRSHFLSRRHPKTCVTNQPTTRKGRVFFFLRSRPKTGLLPHYFWPLHNLHTDVPGSPWSSRTWNWKENFEQLPSSHKNNTPTLANYYVFLETLCCPRPISKFLLSTDGMRRRKGYIPFLLLNFSERGREKSLRSDI